MPAEGLCLVPGWADTSESMRFRANGGPALPPPREYPPHWIRSCSTKRVEDLVIQTEPDYALLSWVGCGTIGSNSLLLLQKENRKGDSDDWRHGAKLVDKPSGIGGFLG